MPFAIPSYHLKTAKMTVIAAKNSEIENQGILASCRGKISAETLAAAPKAISREQMTQSEKQIANAIAETRPSTCSRLAEAPQLLRSDTCGIEKGKKNQRRNQLDPQP